MNKTSTKCTILQLLRPWFEKYLKENYSSDVTIQYTEDEFHFEDMVNVEIWGPEIQIEQIATFIQNISRLAQYKLPWLNETMYYVKSGTNMQLVKQKLENIKALEYLTDEYSRTTRYITPVPVELTVFEFWPQLSDAYKLELDLIFKSFNDEGIDLLFIKHEAQPPNSTDLSAKCTTSILHSFTGAFLYYLDLQDIISLELANKTHDSWFDIDLNRDLQNHLERRFPELYAEARIDSYSCSPFTIKNVLWYFIEKYHDHFVSLLVPNILKANEIGCLAQRYGIRILYQNLVHVDFRPPNNAEIVDFCVMYHSNTAESGECHLKYAPEYATESYTVHFNADESLDRLSLVLPVIETASDIHFTLKNKNNSLSLRTANLLARLTEHCTANGIRSHMTLYEFDLRQISGNIFNEFLSVCYKSLTFINQNIELRVFRTILEKSVRDPGVHFDGCRILLDDYLSDLSTPLSVEQIHFRNMDFDFDTLLTIFGQLNPKNAVWLTKCRFSNSNIRTFPNAVDIHVAQIHFRNSTFETALVFRLFEELHHVLLVFSENKFVQAAEDLPLSTPKLYQLHLIFINMEFELQILSNILEKFGNKTEAWFKNCCFYATNRLPARINPVKRANIKFSKINFVAPVLHEMLRLFNKNSYICLENCCILTLTSNALCQAPIELAYLNLENVKFERQTLVKILQVISSDTVELNNCIFVKSSGFIESQCNISPPRLPYLKLINMGFESSDLLSIAAIFNSNSDILVTDCVIRTSDDPLADSLPQIACKLLLTNTIINSQIASKLFSLMANNSLLEFNNCRFASMTDVLSNRSIRTQVQFKNMSFKVLTVLKMIANLTSEARIYFIRCQFQHTLEHILPNTVLQPCSVAFKQMEFELHDLVMILERLSTQTSVRIESCHIRTINRIYTSSPIKIQFLQFDQMSLEIETILRILENFTECTQIVFTNCTLRMGSSLSEQVLSLIVKPLDIVFDSTTSEVNIFQTLFQKCCNETKVTMYKCKIIPIESPEEMFVNLKSLELFGIEYGPGLLQLLQHLIGDFLVEYNGQISDEGLIEICANTKIASSSRLAMPDQIIPLSVYFQLFTEYFNVTSQIHDWFTDTEYDIPTHVIPHLCTTENNLYDWSNYKVKMSEVTGSTFKVDFYENGKPIDLFFKLNNLPDDSGSCDVRFD